MEESIKVQAEFENLIEQLERLRTVNELTSANTESAKQVIRQIDSFVLSTNEYKKKIEADLDYKNKSIEKVILHLKKSIDSLEFQSQSLSKTIESSFGILKNETGVNFNLLSEGIANKIELAQKTILDLQNSLSAKSDGLENNLIEFFTKQSNIVLSEINENKIEFRNKLNAQDIEIKLLKRFFYIIFLLIACGVGAVIILLKWQHIW